MTMLNGRRKWIQNVCGSEPDDYDGEALRWIANGPLCDALRPFCPAGRLTLAQAKAREAAQVSSE